MSDKFTVAQATSVGTPGNARGSIGLWGHIPYDEAIAELRKHYERQRDEAVATLAAIERGEVKVFHQYGPWAARNRREVQP